MHKSKFLAAILTASMLITSISVPAWAEPTDEIEIEIEDNLSEVEAEYPIFEAEDDTVIPAIPDELLVPALSGDNTAIQTIVASASRFDPRPEKADFIDNVSTELKNQMDNTCWAYSTTSAIEASINKNNGIFGGAALSSLDLAERQLFFFTYNNDETPTDIFGGTIGDNVTFKNKSDGSILSLSEQASVGGLAKWGIETFASGAGFGLEKDAPMSGYKTPLEQISKLQKKYYLSDTYIFNSEDGHKFAKQVIAKFGGIIVSYYNTGAGYSTKDGETYFYRPNARTNHAVNIIGWDDNIPASNFPNKPEHDGGWLIKESADRYFWMSYDNFDAVSGGRIMYAVNAKELKDTEALYEYDSAILDSEKTYSESYANVFEAQRGDEETCEMLTGVTVKFAAPGSKYSVQVYKNPVGDKPASGKAMLKAPVTGTVPAAGYCSIDFKEQLKLRAGDRFSVVVSLSKGVAEETPSIYCSMNIDSNSTSSLDGTTKELVLASREKCFPGQSYCMVGGAWVDLATLSPRECARIKARTVLVEDSSEDIDTAPRTIYPGESFDIKSKGIATASGKGIVEISNMNGVIRIKGLKKGSSTVKIVRDGVTYKIKVKVISPVVMYDNITASSLQLDILNSAEPTITGDFIKPVYSSNKPDIVSVDSNTGKITALRSGSAVITVAFGGTIVKKKVKVPKVSIAKIPTLTTGVKDYQLIIMQGKINILSELPADRVEFSSNNPAVAAVSSSGKLSAVSAGNAVISCKIGDNYVITAKVKVK